jgi:hypothetical protein
MYFHFSILFLSALSLADVTTVYITKYATAAGTDGSSQLPTNSTPTSPSIAPAQTTLSLFNACASPGNDTNTNTCDRSNITYYGAVVTANPTATIFAIDCAARLNSTACASSAITVTQGPSMFALAQPYAAPDDPSDAAGVLSLSCSITSSTQAAVCRQADVPATAPEATGTGAAAFVANSENGTLPVAAAATMSFAGSEIWYDVLVITAGAEKLESGGATRTPVAPTCKLILFLDVCFLVD